MGPWGPDCPVQPEKVLWDGPEARWDYHCDNECCQDTETCSCECSWCDCRYAERMGS
jgi:hypothetical protein